MEPSSLPVADIVTQVTDQPDSIALWIALVIAIVSSGGNLASIGRLVKLPARVDLLEQTLLELRDDLEAVLGAVNPQERDRRREERRAGREQRREEREGRRRGGG